MTRAAILLCAFLAGCATCNTDTYGTQMVQIASAFYVVPYPMPRCE